MTAAERQARRRRQLREVAKAVERALLEREQPLASRLFQPPHGYGKAKALLRAQGHHFEWARREWGFEEGTFVDGAFLGSGEVVALADLAPAERQERLAETRQQRKDMACVAVEGYMAALRVSLDELIQNRRARDEPHERQRLAPAGR
jgi:hypothetical protein